MQNFSTYFSKYRNAIKKSTKVILVPKDSIQIIDIIAKYCLYDLSIYLIEIEENLFYQIKSNYIYTNNNSSFYGKVITKKYELFAYKKLYTILFFESFFIGIFSLFYKCKLHQFRNNLKLFK